jgi:hypothetical protein
MLRPARRPGLYSVLDLMRLEAKDNEEIFPKLRQTRKDMQRLIMQADEYKAMSSNVRRVADWPSTCLSGPPINK